MAVWFVLNHMAVRNLMKSVPTTCFATYGFSKAIPGRPMMVSEGFQRGLKPSLFFLKESSEMVVWFVLNHMAARNWMKSALTTCFATYGLSKAIPRRPVMVSEGFQRGFKEVWNRVVSEGFQRGLKPCGFKRVSEGFETAWFQRGFRGVWNRVVSEGFQRGLKPCGFRGVSEGSETVWFQRDFRGVWKRMVSEGFQRGLKPCGFRGVSEGFQRGLKPSGFRGVSEGSETVWFQRGFQRVWNCRYLLGEAPKNLKKSLGKNIQTQNTSFYWEKPYKKKHWKNNLAEPLDFENNTLERRRNKFSKVFVQNHPMKNHTKFLLGNRPYEALKKTFWKNCYFSFKKNLGEAPKNLKKSLGSIQTKNIPFFIGKIITKRNIEETIWQNRLICKNNPHGRDVAINFQKSSSKIIQWKIMPIFIGKSPM